MAAIIGARLVGLLVTLHPKDRSPAPPGKDADPQESLWDFKWSRDEAGGERSETVRSLAVIGDRRFRVERCEKAHWKVGVHVTSRMCWCSDR